MGSGASQQSPNSSQIVVTSYPQTGQTPYYRESLPPSFSNYADTSRRVPATTPANQLSYPGFQPPYQNSHFSHSPVTPQYTSGMPAPSLEQSPPPSPHLPPSTASQQHRERYSTSSEEGYGEQDYDLKEMTWPMQSCDLLLTDKDLREGDDFIQEMEEKRVMYESIQTELLSRLKTSNPVNLAEMLEMYDMITELCELSHFLHSDTGDELGIEFLPAEDSEEDTYILEQLESLTKRHHKELKDSDKRCADQLLEGRGSNMTEQKLDSILEEHITLRSYMRTRQTREQIAAYNQKFSSIQENPSAFSKVRKTQASTEDSQPVTSVAAHPIVNRLPPISQSKLRTIGATRGRTQVVDQHGHVVNSASTSKPTDASITLTSYDTVRDVPDIRHNLGQAGDINTASIWSRIPSEDEAGGQEDVAPPHTNQLIPTTLPSSAAANAENRLSDSPELTLQQTDLNRTGVISGTVASRISQFALAPEEPYYSSHSESAEAVSELKIDDNDELEEEDEDLVGHYRRRLGGGNTEVSSDTTSVTLSDRAGSPFQRSSDTESDHDFDNGNKTLMASAKLKQEVSKAIWENQDEINPQTFHELISMWQDKQKDIAEKGDYSGTTPTGRDMWKKVKEKILHAGVTRVTHDSDSDSENEDNPNRSTSSSSPMTSASTSVSSSMQTSLTRGNSISVQTDAVKYGMDAETLVDEFLVDDQEKKKIRKKDRQLLNQLTSKELTDDELRRLLSSNRQNIEKLRKERELKRLVALNLLDEKKARRNQEEEWISDEETNQKLDKIEERLTNKLLKHRGKVSENDLKNLLKDARQRQDEILRQRNIEKVRQNERMREKLLEKKKAKVDAEKGGSGDEELFDLKDKFYKDLKSQLASGNLNQQQFRQLIDEHLSKMSSTASVTTATGSHKQDMKQSNEELAQLIIRQGDKTNKVIQDVRQRQRQNARKEVEQKRLLKRKS